ncbi:MAG: FemAB family XrtA/PEP-CTERM system-associated protein [Allosphingosinicella sp.]
MNAIASLVPAVRTVDLDDAAECARIDTFVAGHPDGTVFHRPQWSRTVERGCGQRAHYLIAEQGGRIVGCLPLTEIRSLLFGHAMVSAGFATGGGVIGESDSARAALAAAGWALTEHRGCSGMELRGACLPEGWIRQEGIYANFERRLPNDAVALLSSLPRRQRAEVRRAEELGLTTSAGTDRRHRDAHFRVYAESVRNLGTPVFPRRLFEAALDEFGDDADVVIVWQDAQPVAALLNFYFKGTCQPYWGGGTRAARQCRANDLVYFDVMRRAIARGCSRADFGRSKVGTGPWQRKRIWDFDETPLVYAVRTADGAAPREINPTNPRYRLQVAAWQRLPLAVANRVGPFLARGLG